ncbi:MAG: glycoside hydrolase family 2 protein, partial [Clostridia bacterium]|nr:glycoside hydrolase family 2 protein [Clostridia bacterium]
CNFLDLMKNSVIPDPFYGLNEKDCEFVGKLDWEYSRSFTLTAEDTECDEIYLNCKMLDTFCHIYLNGKEIAYTENCHIGYSFKVKEYLKEGENELTLLFLSPVKYVEKIASETTVPPNANGMNGVAFVRKPQCHYGWDWGPVLVPSGISGDIGLEFVKKARVKHLGVTQAHADGKVTVSFDCEAELFSDDVKCTVTLVHPDGKEETAEAFKGSFTVENPELWWTKELSGKDTQPLYKVKAELKSEDEVLSSAEKKIGLRTLVLDRSRDEYGSNFRFVLNGVPMFAKGANWIPADSFINRFDEKALNMYIDAALFSNFNLIRLWGGGYYESDEMYDLCDEKGILLWQDFAFACQPYPFFKEDFLNNVKNEIEYNVKRLSHHASLALWSGNNEIEAMCGGWLHLREYIKWTEKFFYNILPEELRKYDKVTSFIPGSPCGTGHNKGVNADNVGDTHLWSVWHGLAPMKEYRHRMTRFCSEFGFESLPDIKTVAAFAEEKDYELESDVMKSHQKCGSGNAKMFYYIRTRFKVPQHFEDYVYLSQITQLNCIEDATEHWRRNKGRCNGALYWQFNDCWPVCSWSSIDYYGNYKALQYGARHFNRPVTVSFEDKKNDLTAYLINDLREDKKVTVRLSIFDFEKGIVSSDEKEITVKALTNEKVFRKDLSVLRRAYDVKKSGVLLSLIEDGEETVRRVFLFDQEKNLDLPAAVIKTEKKIADGKIEITLTADKFARLVRLESASVKNFSDNCFDLLPGESRTVTIDIGDDISAEELMDSIRVISLTDIPTRKMTTEEKIMVFKMAASPMNIGNMIFHRQRPKDVEL